MIRENDTKKLSKFLSYVLRHNPEAIGISLDANGWADVRLLLKKMNEAGTPIDFEILNHIVDTNNKRRFAFNDAKNSVRASQGHSVEIELGYEPQAPPEILCHGTAIQNTAAILANGILKGNRHHVHLSSDKTTACNVGQRYGKPAIFEVTALQMHNDGFTFFLSENGVWLTDHVPANYLKQNV